LFENPQVIERDDEVFRERRGHAIAIDVHDLIAGAGR
jgi:hypothetical protein